MKELFSSMKDAWLELCSHQAQYESLRHGFPK